MPTFTKRGTERSQPRTAPEKEPSPAQQIKAARAVAEKIIESRAQEVKASDGAPLPIEWIRQNVRAMAKAGGCSCKCALAILEDDAGSANAVKFGEAFDE
jgi:hypothetical protein